MKRPAKARKLDTEEPKGRPMMPACPSAPVPYLNGIIYCASAGKFRAKPHKNDYSDKGFAHGNDMRLAWAKACAYVEENQGRGPVLRGGL